MKNHAFQASGLILKSTTNNLFSRASRFAKIFFLGVITMTAAGCATPEKSGFLPGNEPMHPGRFVKSYWSVTDLSQQNLSSIYIEPVDISRIQNEPDLAANIPADFLRSAITKDIRNQTSWKVTEQPDPASARLALAITYLTTGSVAGRMLAAELGAGHAFVQVDGKLITASGIEIACFSDRRRDSGSIGFEDFGGDSGPRMVKRMLKSISSDFVKELLASTNSVK